MIKYSSSIICFFLCVCACLVTVLIVFVAALEAK